VKTAISRDTTAGEAAINASVDFLDRNEVPPLHPTTTEPFLPLRLG
jgi:hypothetical protein